MNWTDLLDALLIAAVVFAVLLRVFDRLTRKQTLGTLTGAYLALAVSGFLQDEPWSVGIYAVCAVIWLALLRRERARRNTAESRTTKSRV